jgi:hypothetical protein
MMFHVVNKGFCQTFVAMLWLYQKLSQKASPNAGGDEWLCSLFLRTHFFMLTFKGILFIIVNDLIRVLYEDKNHRSKNQSETLPLRL